MFVTIYVKDWLTGRHSLTDTGLISNYLFEFWRIASISLIDWLSVTLTLVWNIIGLQRVVPIKGLQGLTKLLKAGTQEFVLHIKKEHDYRLLSEQ